MEQSPPAALAHIEDLVGSWVHGWARARGVLAPTSEVDGYRLDVASVGHLVRYVLPTTRTVAARARGLNEPGTWLKVCGPRSDVLDRLTPAWKVGEPEYLMSTAVSPPALVETPEPYTLQVKGADGVHHAVVCAPSGERAAGAVAALAGRAAVFDQVVTEPAHRRRGLAGLAVGALTAAVAERGAEHAVLVATEDGRKLYERMGWTVVCEVTAAHL
ncbi:FR47-like protein [Nocardiopsis sp. Huas11]|uniref:GNAT family N-acetyltransferase n=1 Tax=Nocardiopsis sp. Huas11 TaxID=2183912 RepID=UPI000EB211B7|nr:GNAT family N-acetyltransferase [Nocardiopsis sp. Huas11]RKS08667.1 FR47-like protein [Nocardiopsis sp. Huas11]